MFNNNQNNPTGNYSNNGNMRNATPYGVADFETLQKARRDLIGELDAIIEYVDHIHKTNIEIAKATLIDIRNEELNHMGQLLALITYLAPYQTPLIESGLTEFNDILNKN